MQCTPPPPPPYAMRRLATKQAMRGPVAERVRGRLALERAEFLAWMARPDVQARLQHYLSKLKK
jgi:hypothetical protein